MTRKLPPETQAPNRVRVDRLIDIRQDLGEMSEAEVRVLQIFVEERLAELTQSAGKSRAKAENG